MVGDVYLGAVAVDVVDRVREGGAERLGIGGFGWEDRFCKSPSSGPDIGTDGYDILCCLNLIIENEGGEETCSKGP